MIKGSLEPLRCIDFRSLHIIGSLMESYEHKSNLEKFANQKIEMVKLNHTKY